MKNCNNSVLLSLLLLILTVLASVSGIIPKVKTVTTHFDDN